MSVDMVLTDREYPTFEEAQQNPVHTVRDGDPLWLHIKYPTSLADWASHTPDSFEQADRDNRRISLGIGPAGSQELWQTTDLVFTLPEAEQMPEHRVCLSRGMGGKNRSTPMFLSLVAGGSPGVWNNQMVLFRKVGLAWDAEIEPLAICPITVDVAGGMDLYQRAQRDYAIDETRGNVRTDRAPMEGRFFDKQVRQAMLEAIDNRGYDAEHFYFTDDDWQVTGSDRPEFRQVSGAFLYRRGDEFLRGNVVLAKQWNVATETWAPDFMDPVIEDGFPLDEEAYHNAPGKLEAETAPAEAAPAETPSQDNPDLADVPAMGDYTEGDPAASAPLAPTAPMALTVGQDLIAQIRQLAGLKDEGIISDEEFQTKKAELLARL